MQTRRPVLPRGKQLQLRSSGLISVGIGYSSFTALLLYSFAWMSMGLALRQSQILL